MSSRLQLTAHAQVLSRQHFAGPKIKLMTAKCHSNVLPSQAASWDAIFSADALAPGPRYFFGATGFSGYAFKSMGPYPRCPPSRSTLFSSHANS